MLKKELSRTRRHNRIRKKIQGTEKRPRLVVFRSLNFTYAQIINDDSGKVIASASDQKVKSKGTKSERAKEVGTQIAKLAKEKNVESIVFDRNGYKYHGRVKALADGARSGGLIF